MQKSKNVLFLMSGSISCYKACGIISDLVKQGINVDVAVTKSAHKFIGNATLEGLTGNRVYDDSFEDGQMMSHISLIKKCDLVILCPATANIINKMASGIGDDLVSSLFLAHDFSKPFIVAPAMNTNMYNHPTTQHSLGKLREWGVKQVGPEVGVLACGDTGMGRLAQESLITESIIEELKNV